MYYVQRFAAAVPPEEAGRRLAGHMTLAGFALEGNGCLPCARFQRGNLANNFFVISPKLWRVTVDTRVEADPAGGSSVEACWTIQTVSQIVLYTETRYWRAVMAELRDAVSGSSIGPARSESVARVSVLVLLSLIIAALGLAGVVAVHLSRSGTPRGIVMLAALAIACAVLFAFRDWRGLRKG
jgi:hypothetical protein